MNAIAITLHLLATVIWVGGMFFAYLALRPALTSHALMARAHVWAAVLKRFFPWVWICVPVILVTGFYLVFHAFGGFRNLPLFVNLMMGLGILMMLLFVHVYFAPYRRLRHSVEINDEAVAGKAMNQIRVMMLVNLILGLLVILVATSGVFWFYD